MKIGVTGATGQLGTVVVEELKKRVPNENIVALIRTPEKASAQGVEVRTFDYTKPQVMLEALAGIDRLFDCIKKIHPATCYLEIGKAVGR